MISNKKIKFFILHIAFCGTTLYINATSNIIYTNKHHARNALLIETLIKKTQKKHSKNLHYLISNTIITYLYQSKFQTKNIKKKLTLMVYIAADNDLHIFAWKNIRQLAEIAPLSVNILVFLTEPGKNKKSQIYLIEKNKATLLNKENTLKLDSGNPQTLIDFCSFAIKNYPSHNYALFLWDHGTGIIDPFRKPYRGKINSPSELFSINASTMQLEVNRDICFLDYIIQSQTNIRGICFDDTYNTYLTNQKLEYALQQIQKELAGKKLMLVGFDACLMAQIEIANILKNYTDYMIASQEIELGAGWRYDKLMKFFADPNNTINNFPSHIVHAYKEAYAKITPDYTLSAINLEKISELEENINNLALVLTRALNNQLGSSAKNAIKISKEKIGFDEPTYIDLYSFCEKLIKNLDYIKTSNNEKEIKEEIEKYATNCLKNIASSVVANTSGSNVGYAKGISIYFPEKTIHSSYEKTTFATNNNWFKFLLKYIAS